MATLSHKLQNEVFHPNDERLLAMCHVGKFLKKKKMSFLCLITTISPPFSVSIVQVKQTDKSFKRKRSWALEELKVVDGKSNAADTEEFDLHIDKVYRWVASNLKERQSFIKTLWQQCSKYVLKDKAVFKNIPNTWIAEDVVATPENKYIHSPGFGFDGDLNEEFQSVTDKEQEDLQKYDKL